MGLQVPEQIISPAVIFAAEVAGERPDTLVSLADMSLEAVKLGERLAASRPVLQDPEADLLFFSRDVFPLLLDDLWRRRLRWEPAASTRNRRACPGAPATAAHQAAWSRCS